MEERHFSPSIQQILQPHKAKQREDKNGSIANDASRNDAANEKERWHTERQR